MQDRKKMSLLEETEREAREIEQELEQHPELEEIQVTDAMDAALFAKIQAYEESKKAGNPEESVEFSEELVPGFPKNTAEEKTIPYRKHGKKKYIVIGIAAVLVIVMSAGFVGVGNKAYWKEVLQKDYGEDKLKIIKVEDMDDIQSEDEESGTVFSMIDDELGTSVVRLKKIPKEMFFSNVELVENMQCIRMFYEYKGEVIRYTIYLNSNDSERAENIEDEKIDEYTVLAKNGELEIKVKEYQVPKYEENRRIANFEYKGIYYQLKGIMDKEDFNEILENLRFF